MLHNEYFIYLENALRWPQLKCKQGNASFCESVLIVADPQILNPKIENGRLGASYLGIDIKYESFCVWSWEMTQLVKFAK